MSGKTGEEKGKRMWEGFKFLLQTVLLDKNVTYVSSSLEPMVSQVMDLLKASNS